MLSRSVSGHHQCFVGEHSKCDVSNSDMKTKTKFIDDVLESMNSDGSQENICKHRLLELAESTKEKADGTGSAMTSNRRCAGHHDAETPSFKMEHFLSALTKRIHHHFLLILIGAYVLSVFIPGPGLLIREISFGKLALPAGGAINVSLSLLLLGSLLFNAGLGLKLEEIRYLAQKRMLTFCAFAANTIVPFVFVCLIAATLGQWHNPDEVQNVLVGLALIVSMPIAGSSTAWAQNANGNLALSLGLVLLSTILSPLLTPIVLNGFSSVANAHYANDLRSIATQGSDAFMLLTVLVPSCAGILLGIILGAERKAKLAANLKLANYAVLLTLNYSNAATSLPKAILQPDWDLLALVSVTTAVLCGICFTIGGLIGKIFKANKSDTASLMFGLGMNNNGTGLVLAASMLAEHSQIMLPLIFFTLFQQIIAAFVDRKFFE
ncbi:MAG: bile acid:sodium symporter [Candidatus Obscuribacterales bacterium]|nr:bile acid:sodium symporter [Candidatus Obscuribacterales bacterium]